jgi:hypothetical protein
MNSRLQLLKKLPRRQLLTEIRRAAGDQSIVLWEQIPYGEIYKAVQAGPETAVKLGVKRGDVIGYVCGDKPSGASSVMGLMNAVRQDKPPYPDPFG